MKLSGSGGGVGVLINVCDLFVPGLFYRLEIFLVWARMAGVFCTFLRLTMHSVDVDELWRDRFDKKEVL